ncbi:MAG TPA: Crp/Fnr family transcriptional regulator [Steroidobacteraceae bacterium]|nr:Crp/Fnr family transcriptional regulator [Steroidobacteraceae bacterium]
MPAVTNTLIDALPRTARNRLLSICEPVDLVSGNIVSGSDSTARHVYFPTGSIISLMTSSKDSPVLEVGMVGSEGMLGLQVVLAAGSVPLQANVRGPGSAWRVATEPFNRELAGSRALQQSLNCYLQVTLLQFTSEARCVRFHQINQRLARWLLMTHDRTHADSFSVTQALMAHLMGVRRVGIAKAAGTLQRKGFIRYVRGVLTIVDRKGLESESCSCYETAQANYARFMS